MIDLNHILLFIACISPLVMLAQTLRRGQELPLDEVLPGLHLSVDEVFAALA